MSARGREASFRDGLVLAFFDRQHFENISAPGLSPGTETANPSSEARSATLYFMLLLAADSRNQVVERRVQGKCLSAAEGLALRLGSLVRESLRSSDRCALRG